MKLPNGEAAFVGEDKITQYLLNPAHPDNGGKATFFFSLGFTVAEWETLAVAFRNIARTATVTRQSESPHGSKFVIDDYIESRGTRAAVRTVWAIDRGSEIPRLVTAYPQQKL